MATVLITGGTGLIGKSLSKLLAEKGHHVIILSRSKENPNSKPPSEAEGKTPNISYARWDVQRQTIDEKAIKQADHIIHLAGANVGEKRWTKKRKQEILESRTQSAALLVKALEEHPNKVQTVVSASGIGWYGADTPSSRQHGFMENDPPADDFLGQTCLQWEKSMEPMAALGKRVVILRTGLVLDNTGGVLQEFKKPLYAGVAAILGNGKQVVSWIHIQDICRLYLHAVENTELKGAYNAVAHQPVTNKTLVLELAQRMRGKFFLPMHVPTFALKTLLGEMSIEVLKSTTVSNERIRHAGFKFLFPTLEAALNQLQKGL